MLWFRCIIDPYLTRVVLDCLKFYLEFKAKYFRLIGHNKPINESSSDFLFVSQPCVVPSSSSQVARRSSPRRNGVSRSGIARSTLSDVVTVPSNQTVPTSSTTLTKDLSNNGNGGNKICSREVFCRLIFVWR